MLIRNAEVWNHGLADVRIESGRIAEIGSLAPHSGEHVIDAQRGALLPGLHDHHIHLAGLAVRRSSLWCGPPEVTNAADLAQRLCVPGDGWLRGMGYHESVMGIPDAAALDELVTHRPFRMQHRGGRMWLLNSLAVDLLLERAAPPPGLERENGKYTGRLLDEDVWLRLALGSLPPDFSAISQELATHGLTGLTDMTPHNDEKSAQHFARQSASGALLQHVFMAGTLALDTGYAKLHLHEAAMPDFDAASEFVRAAHGQNRGVAVHCTTEVEMVFALALLEDAGAHPLDRIEHASIADSGHIARLAALGVTICVQPHFIAERGDTYLVDVERRHRADLYRLASLAGAGIPLCGGSDAPLASADPWTAMRAAVSRQTTSGMIIGKAEALSPEAALALYLADPGNPARQRRIGIGEPADLCLLDLPWAQARNRLTSRDIRAVWISGECIHQTPVESGSSRDSSSR